MVSMRNKKNHPEKLYLNYHQIPLLSRALEYLISPVFSVLTCHNDTVQVWHFGNMNCAEITGHIMPDNGFCATYEIILDILNSVWD